MKETRIQGKMAYWLLKSEPDTYSIDDLDKEQETVWDGVRNYQARNFLKEMHINDLAFFYHSNTKIPSIVGLTRVIEENVSDPTQFDPNSPYYDPKSSLETPRWQTVKVTFIKKLRNAVSLEQLKQMFLPEELLILRRGNRLSVIPVSERVALKILEIGEETPFIV